MERSATARRARATLRPLRLAGRDATQRLQRWRVTARESSYAASRRMRDLPPWCVAPDTLALAWFRGLPNFGDEISPLVVEHMTGRRTRWVSPDFTSKVVAVGSLLAYVRPGDVVIGTGAIRPERRPLPRGARVLALRGPRTADMLGVGDLGTAYGDPGLLAASALGVEAAPVEGRIGLVPHYVDHKEVSAGVGSGPWSSSDLTVIDVQSGPRKVIEEISRLEVCVSSSLHGLIIAESFGIPAIWTSISDGITGGTFKFDDYYEGTGRVSRRPLPLREALELASCREAEAFSPDVAPLEDAFLRLRDAVA